MTLLRCGRCTTSDQVASGTEVSGYLVGSPAFKAGGTGDPRAAGSIPVHLRRSMKLRVWRAGQFGRLGGRISEAGEAAG